MKTFKEIREGYVSAAQRKAVWASRADGGKGKNETIMTSAERAKEMQKKANAAKKKAQGQAAKAGYKAEGKDDYAKAMADYKAKGGKITKVAPGKAAGYHGKDDPGKDMKGMMDKGDTKAIGTRKKVKSMGEAKQTHMFDNEKDARAKAKEIGGKYVKGTGKSAGKHAAIKEKQVNELKQHGVKETKVDEISANLAGRAYSAANKQTNYKKVTPTTAKKSDQGKKALAYHQRKSIDPSHTGTTFKGSGTDVAQDHAASSEPARKTAGKRIADLRKKGADVDENQDTGIANPFKEPTAKIGIKTIVKGKEVKHKPTFGLKQIVRGKEVKESVASVAASAKGDHRAHMKAAKAHAVAAVKHMDQYKETNDPAHQKAARLHRKAEQSHEGTAKLHKTSNNGQTKMTRTSIANKATAAANAASEDV